MEEKYLAHISEDGREQLLKDHLMETARLAAEFAEEFQCGDLVKPPGVLHDVGKYSHAFQGRLHGGTIVDHSTAGAIEISRMDNKIANKLAAFCIAGHHGGLIDGGSDADGAGTPTLKGRLQKQVDDYSYYKKEISLQPMPGIPLKPLGKGGFTLSFLTRMLFSCLVDADFLDTERFMHDGRIVRPSGHNMEELNKKLKAHVSSWLDNRDRDTINGRRTEILCECMEKGNDPPGCFTLTVPTGGGKTVSSLAFALQHAVKHGMQRILYVIPYNSIIEQNAAVFRNILGTENVLEAHSNVSFEDSEFYEKQKLASENFDLPVVVTTNVQFFESFYSNRTSKCRKLHNIANSVIIFDEAQMLPRDYLIPCLQVIGELIVNYHCSAVLCTATQPALKPYLPKAIRAGIKEISSNVEDNFHFFKRTEIRNEGEISEEYLVELLKKEAQVLCILNSRKEVRNIFEQMEQMEGTFHLSTYMYPEHRKRILEEIRERLKNGKPCRVIATSLIEAGVDLDFPSVWRNLAGIDSVIQAAGRCNREGKMKTEKCITHVFTIEGKNTSRLPYSLRHPITVAEEVIRQYEDISSPDAVQKYFRILFKDEGDSLDKKKIVEKFEEKSKTLNFPFATVAGEFHLIEQETKAVLIPKEVRALEIAEKLRTGMISKRLLREAGLYSVNLYCEEFEKLLQAGKLEVISEDLAVLTPFGEYSMTKGLNTETEGRAYYI